MSIPNSTIYIANVCFSSNYEHVPFYESRSAQQSGLGGNVLRTFTSYTFLRETNSIKVHANKSETSSWNYLWFTNDGGANYFYYFIDRIEYVNDTTVELFLTLDVMQTYHFRYNLHPCFVERGHTPTDNIGDNIVEEDLELGEFVVDEEINVTNMDELVILVLSTINLKNTREESQDDGSWKPIAPSVFGTKIDGVFSGACLYGCPVHRWSSVVNALKIVEEAGKGEGIIAMWMYPKNLVTLVTGDSWVPSTDTSSSALVEVYGYDFFNVQVGRTERIGGSYYPTHKKLLTYPYKFIYITNNLGGSATYRFEDFANNGFQFRTTGSALPDGSARIYPLNYKGSEHNWDEGVSMNGFPMCCWNQDVYKMWLAQNKNTQNLAIGTGTLTVAGGVATALGSVVTGNLLGAGAGIATAIGGGTKIANVLAQRKDSEIQPPQAKGSLSGSVNTANGKGHFTIQIKTIKTERARMIDDYFTLYGYAIRRVMQPKRRTRRYFTYLKTNGCKIAGDVPTDHMRQIEAIYDKGTTFWWNGEHMADTWPLNNYPIGDSAV